MHLYDFQLYILCVMINIVVCIFRDLIIKVMSSVFFVYSFFSVCCVQSYTTYICTDCMMCISKVHKLK